MLINPLNFISGAAEGGPQITGTNSIPPTSYVGVPSPADQLDVTAISSVSMAVGYSTVSGVNSPLYLYSISQGTTQPSYYPWTLGPLTPVTNQYGLLYGAACNASMCLAAGVTSTHSPNDTGLIVYTNDTSYPISWTVDYGHLGFGFDTAACTPGTFATPGLCFVGGTTTASDAPYISYTTDGSSWSSFIDTLGDPYAVITSGPVTQLFVW